jgi:anti-anti-sigma factor
MTKLACELIRQNDVWTLKLSGNINSSTAQFMWGNESSDSLAHEMRQAQVKKLMVDLANVEFIDSHGLRLFLTVHREFSSKNIQMVLLNPNPHLKRLFRIMQFDRVLVIKSNE